MKRSIYYLFSVFALINVAKVCAQTPFANIVFENKIIEIGEIDCETKSEFDLVFNFENTGDASLVIHEVKASCGCTTPEFPKHPIMPGEKGSIKVKFKLGGNEGTFSKHLIINSNAKEDIIILKIKGQIKTKV